MSQAHGRWERRVAYLAVTVFIAGFALAGAAAGVRVAMVDVVGLLDCASLQGPDCTPIVAALNGRVSTFLWGGVIAMVCGGVGVWGLKREVDSDDGE